MGMGGVYSINRGGYKGTLLLSNGDSPLIWAEYRGKVPGKLFSRTLKAYVSGRNGDVIVELNAFHGAHFPIISDEVERFKALSGIY